MAASLIIIIIRVGEDKNASITDCEFGVGWFE